MVSDGWSLAMISDLRRLVAAQGSIVVDRNGIEAPLDPDPLAVAKLALPLAQPAVEIPASFDQQRQIWQVRSPSPNLRITGRFGGEVRPNALGFGFIVEVLISFMSVAEHNGRLVLRDGYHRAHRLLSAGIVSAPAFIRSFANDEPIFGREMLPAQIWQGEHPPQLADYGDDRLAHDIWLPRQDTTLYISAQPHGLAVSHEL